LLDATMEQWLDENDGHVDRPDGLACLNLADMMASAAAAVYDASHAAAAEIEANNAMTLRRETFGQTIGRVLSANV
ncbi:hypothetical protein ACI3PL_24395, partial [Lacticaseibacillus paracasei]